MRLGYDSVDLSEMYIVEQAYRNKSQMRIRMQGNMYFSEGGQLHDAIDIIKENGMMPESVFSGKKLKDGSFDHQILFTKVDSLTNEYTQAEVTISNQWETKLDGLLQSGIGFPPKEFTYKGKKENALSFKKRFTNFNPESYLEVTSYSHHPIHTFFVLEDKYNWSLAPYYNLSFDEWCKLPDLAIANGYSVGWSGDVLENNFDYLNGNCVLDDEQIVIDAKARQSSFDDHSTSMNHGMHIIGIAYDLSGKKFYVLKNSWGKVGPYEGLVYMSEQYFSLKTVALFVHKDVLTKMNLNLQ